MIKLKEKDKKEQKNINKWRFIYIDQIKNLADFFGAVQTPTEYVFCISYTDFGQITEGP